MNRLAAIGLIWLCCAIAWMVLGSTILFRSGDTSASRSGEVHQLWGPPLSQPPPRALYKEQRKVSETVTTKDDDGKTKQTLRERSHEVETDIALAATDIRASLKLEHRRKGLLWFPTYEVSFDGRFDFENDSGEARDIELSFPLSAANALYDGFRVVDGEGREIDTTVEGGFARWTSRFEAGERRRYGVKYRSRGTESWHYQMTAGTGRVKSFQLVLDTDFADIDFPSGTLSPSLQRLGGDSWHGEWRFTSLVSSSSIGVDLPRLLNPGPLASRVTFFAPIGLLFFFFVVAVFAAAQGRDLHPLNYFFFGCAFFAFHLLFAYLVDHLAIAPSFTIASIVSVLLVVSYARLFVSWRFALLEMGLSQLIYLVLFSFTFFWEGFTGLSITIGAILTLFVMMQLTGRIRWSKAAEAAETAPADRTPPPADYPETAAAHER